MRAFWCIKSVTQKANGSWIPSFPVGFSYKGCNPIDIRILPAEVTPADHKHAISGSIALGTNHGHYVFYRNETTIIQEHFGGGTAHSHTASNHADYFCVFVVCTSAMYDQLLIDAPNILILGECEIIASEDGSGEIGAVDNTLCDATERTFWEDKFDNFGVDLPDIVINDRRLVTFTLSMFHAPTQNIKNEAHYRYTGLEIVDNIPEIP